MQERTITDTALVLAAVLATAFADTYPETWGFATSFRGRADPNPNWRGNFNRTFTSMLTEIATGGNIEGWDDIDGHAKGNITRSCQNNLTLVGAEETDQQAFLGVYIQHTGVTSGNMPVWRRVDGQRCWHNASIACDGTESFLYFSAAVREWLVSRDLESTVGVIKSDLGRLSAQQQRSEWADSTYCPYTSGGPPSFAWRLFHGGEWVRRNIQFVYPGGPGSAFPSGGQWIGAGVNEMNNNQGGDQDLPGNWMFMTSGSLQPGFACGIRLYVDTSEMTEDINDLIFGVWTPRHRESFGYNGGGAYGFGIRHDQPSGWHEIRFNQAVAIQASTGNPRIGLWTGGSRSVNGPALKNAAKGGGSICHSGYSWGPYRLSTTYWNCNSCGSSCVVDGIRCAQLQNCGQRAMLAAYIVQNRNECPILRSDSTESFTGTIAVKLSAARAEEVTRQMAAHMDRNQITVDSPAHPARTSYATAFKYNSRCTDGDTNGPTDDDGQACPAYFADPGHRRCGTADTTSFNSSALCCACGGGDLAGPPTAPPTISPSDQPTTSMPTAAPTTSNPTMAPTISPTTSTPTVSPTTDPCLAIQCSMDCDGLVAAAGVAFRCGWADETGLCLTGFSTTQHEKDMLHETVPGACSHHTASPTISPTSSEPTAAPNRSPTSGPSQLPTVQPTVDTAAASGGDGGGGDASSDSDGIHFSAFIVVLVLLVLVGAGLAYVYKQNASLRSTVDALKAKGAKKRSKKGRKGSMDPEATDATPNAFDNPVYDDGDAGYLDMSAN